MKRIHYAAVAVASVLAASQASAAPTIDSSAPSGTFMNSSVTCAAGAATPCSFSDTLTFVTPTGFNSLTADISSILNADNPATNIDFSSVTLNGTAFAPLLTGNREYRALDLFRLAAGATNTLVISGTTGGNATYTGNLSFANVAAAVPEASTWAMMLVGFGMIGAVSRYRRRNAMVTYA